MRTDVVRRRAIPLTCILAFASLAAAVTSCKGGISTTGSELSTSQAILDIGQSLVDIREDNAQLQAQIDSLRGIVAYQDTVLRQLAAQGGVGMRPPSAPPP